MRDHCREARPGAASGRLRIVPSHSPASSGFLYTPRGGKKFCPIFSCHCLRLLPPLMYFTKMRFIEALTRTRSGGRSKNRPYLQGNFGAPPPPELSPEQRFLEAGQRLCVVKTGVQNIFNGFLRAKLMGKFRHLVLFNGRSQAKESRYITIGCRNYFPPENGSEGSNCGGN